MTYPLDLESLRQFCEDVATRDDQLKPWRLSLDKWEAVWLGRLARELKLQGYVEPDEACSTIRLVRHRGPVWLRALASVYTPFAVVRLIRSYGAHALDSAERLGGTPALLDIAREAGLTPP